MTVEEKVQGNIQRLAELTEAAVQASQAGDPVKMARAALSAIINKADSNSAELVKLLEDEATLKQGMRFGELVGMARGLLADLSVGSSDSDRSEGDQLASGLGVMVDGAYIDGELADSALAAVKAWQESRPAKSSGRSASGTGEHSAADLGFKVVVSCVKCGDKVASSSKDNLNSLRDQLRKHHADKHGGKFNRGEPTHTAVTEALDKVMHGESTSQDAHGDYTVSRAS